MGEWQPIETAPRDGTRVIVGSTEWTTAWSGYFRTTRPPGWSPAEFERIGPMWTRDGYMDLNLFPTHWMPLPEPPHSSQAQAVAPAATAPSTPPSSAARRSEGGQ